MKRFIAVFVVQGMLCGQASAFDEQFFFGSPATISTEHTLRLNQRALWALPYETTQHQPGHATPAMQKALKAQQSGRYVDAVSILEESPESQTLDAQLLLAGFYLQGGQTQHAQENILQPLLQKFPDSSEAHALLAMAHLQLGQLDRAASAIERARQAGATPWLVRISSYVLQAQGRIEEARLAVAGLNGNGRADAVNLAREAELSLALGEHERAASLIEEARVQAPDSPYVQAISGQVWLVQDQTDKAQRAFEQALRRDPADAKSLMGMGLAKARQGDLPAGIDYLRKAADADLSSAAIQTYLGRALFEAGREQAAEEAYREAIRLDPNDPAPWIYLAQSQVENGRPGLARQSLQQASQRKTAREVYRGRDLLRADEQTLQTNLASVYQHAGLNDLAWLSLTAGTDVKNALSLKNQAEVLQHQRFAENARSSLALQSLFDDELDALPVSLDVYGDRGGQTGAQVPQHGAIQGLTGGRATFGDYGALFTPPTRVSVDALAGNRQTWGEQVRVAAGGARFGASLAQLHYQSDGFKDFDGLDNDVWRAAFKWDVSADTRFFLSLQDFRSEREEIFYPGNPVFAANAFVNDKSQLARLGWRSRLAGEAEWRGVLSSQRTDQRLISAPGTPDESIDTGDSLARSAELQYRFDASEATLVGFQRYRSEQGSPGAKDFERHADRIYASRKFSLGDQWQLDGSLGWAWLERIGSSNDIRLDRFTSALGVGFTPQSGTRFRFGLGQHLGLQEVGSASLVPVETAGFVTRYAGDEDKLVKWAGLGAEHRIAAGWVLHGEALTRRISIPFHEASGGQIMFDANYRQAKLGLVWLPPKTNLSASLEAGYERRDTEVVDYDSVALQRLRYVRLGARWFAGHGLAFGVALSQNLVRGDAETHDPMTYVPALQPYRDRSTQLDAGVQKIFSRGRFELGVRNLLDESFEYVESDPLLPRFSPRRFIFGNVNYSW